MGEKGSITALYTILVEGDDFNEPIADTVRGILDGHIFLSRHLGMMNHYPAIDVLESLSRLEKVLLNLEQAQAVSTARDLLATYRKNEDLIQVGAYVPKTNPKVDLAISKYEPLMNFLKQTRHEATSVEESFKQLRQILNHGSPIDRPA